MSLAPPALPAPPMDHRPSAGAPPRLSRLVTASPPLLRALSAVHAALFLHTAGALGRHWFGSPVLVLETVGRHSATLRTTPVVYLPDGDQLVVVPANGGAPHHPGWWLNLRAAGEAVAVVGHGRYRVRPHEATGHDRDRLWRRFAARTPVDAYQRRTPRRLPVVVLTVVGDAA